MKVAELTMTGDNMNKTKKVKVTPELLDKFKDKYKVKKPKTLQVNPQKEQEFVDKYGSYYGNY